MAISLWISVPFSPTSVDFCTGLYRDYGWVYDPLYSWFGLVHVSTQVNLIGLIGCFAVTDFIAR